MTHVFYGTAEELRSVVEATGVQGEWKENVEAKQHTFRSRTGEILNWWPSKGTLLFQGKNVQGFETLFVEAVKTSGQPTPAAAATTAKIFVVHGHDREARDQLELVLMRLGLKPFILQNADAESKTIIEALEQHIYKESAFGIVLMTPDDFGYAKAAGETEKQPRARQNVVLELGMVMAALGRARMVILKKGAHEMPSDTNGILYIEFNDHVREIVPKLSQRLQGAGFKIEPQPSHTLRRSRAARTSSQREHRHHRECSVSQSRSARALHAMPERWELFACRTCSRGTTLAAPVGFQAKTPMLEMRCSRFDRRR